MAKPRPPHSRKRRTREHVLADLSVNHVERFILRCGWTAERVQHDYGYDLMMWTFNGQGMVENDCTYFQLKATDSLRALRDRPVIPVRLDTRDVNFWLHERNPVILVVYDARGERAYWLWVQEYFRRREPRDPGLIPMVTTVHVPVSAL